MNSAWYVFKTHARDLDSYLKLLENLENKNLPSPVYLQKMGYIRWRLLDLELVKRPGFFVKINISIQKFDFKCFLFWHHLGYTRIQL